MLGKIFLSERNIMAAIFLNAAVIFAMYFPAFRQHYWLELVDHAFILFFVVEALVKMRVFGRKGYFAVGWNRFDFIIVVLSLPSLLVNIIEVPDTSALLILRLFRLVRLLRFIRFVPNLDSVLKGLGRALKASVFVLGALFFLNFFLAIFTCHFFSTVAPEYFGDPLISAYSIFQLFTVEGWNDITADISGGVNNQILIWLTRLYFGFIVLIGGMFGMSLANAVFVDEMTIDNNATVERKIDRLQQEITELRELIIRESNRQ